MHKSSLFCEFKNNLSKRVLGRGEIVEGLIRELSGSARLVRIEISHLIYSGFERTKLLLKLGRSIGPHKGMSKLRIRSIIVDASIPEISICIIHCIAGSLRGRGCRPKRIEMDKVHFHIAPDTD